MKVKIFNLLTASLFTVGVWANTTNAFANNVECLQNQEVVSNIATSNNATSAPENQTSQTNKTTVNRGENEILAGALTSLMLIGLIFAGVRYKKRHSQPPATLQEQIEMLERIWKMNANK